MTLVGVATGLAGITSHVTGGLGPRALHHQPGRRGRELRLMGHPPISCGRVVNATKTRTLTLGEPPLAIL